MPRTTKGPQPLTGPARSLANLTTSRTIRRSLEEQNRIIQHYQYLQQTGISNAEAARRANIPRSTVQRWLRNDRAPTAPTFTTQHSVPVADCIRILSDTREPNRSLLLDALFSLIVWLRWPNGEERFDLALMACALGYSIEDRSKPFLADLSSQSIEFLSTRVRLDALIDIFHASGRDVPWFDYNIREFPLDFDSNDASLRNDEDVCRDIVWLFLNHEIYYRRSNLSLALIHGSLNKILEGYDYISYDGLKKIWSNSAQSAIFHYVLKSSNELRLDLNPTLSSFRNQVNDVLVARDKLQLFFGRCKWVTEELRNRLHPHTFATIKALPFPRSLKSEHFRQAGRQFVSRSTPRT